MIVVPVQLAEIAANFVRSYALSQFPAWRPFAYRFETRASLLSTDRFIDSPLDIHAKMSALTFIGEAAPLGTIYEESYNLQNELSVSNLVAQSTHFKITNGEGIIARSLNATRLVVYYLYQKGKTTEEDNRNLIPIDANTVVVASRHTLINDIGFKKTDLENGMAKIEFHGCDEKIIFDSLNAIATLFKIAP